MTDWKLVKQVQAGDICAIIGLESFNIGDTIADALARALPTVAIDEPTVSVLFYHQRFAFFWKRRKFVTSRHIKERLEKELEQGDCDSSQQTQQTNFGFGRGGHAHHLMRNHAEEEGYELQIGQPQVIIKI